jgi:Sulfotransferase family
MIIFLHIPKTAGSTFQFILENSFGISACHTNHTKKKTFEQADLDFAKRVFPRLKSIAGHNLIDPLQLSASEPFFMTFLREPLSRVISQYYDFINQKKINITYEEFLKTNEYVENLHVRLMAGGWDLDKAKRFLEKCSFVGLTETFDLSLRVFERLSPRKLNLNYKRRRVTPDYSQEIRDKRVQMKEMAEKYNKLDLQLYSFAVNEIFPKICAKAGLNPSDRVESYDHYASDFHFKFILCSLYNMAFYRQLCKLRR